MNLQRSRSTVCSCENSSAVNFRRSTMSFTVVWLEPRRVKIASMNSPKVKGSPSSKSSLPMAGPFVRDTRGLSRLISKQAQEFTLDPRGGTRLDHSIGVDAEAIQGPAGLRPLQEPGNILACA